MDEQPSQDPVTNEDKPADRRRWLKTIDRRTRSVTAITGRILLGVLVISLLTFLIREWTADGYVIQQVNVPESLSQNGYTGPVIANRIRYRLEEIVELTRLQENAQAFKSASDDIDVSVDLIGVGVPVRAIIDMLGSALGIQRKKMIHADIFISGGNLHAIMKISGIEPEHFQVPLGDDPEEAVKSLVSSASESILRHTSDGILQIFYLMNFSYADKAAQLAKFRLQKYQGEPKTEAAILADWAMALYRLKNFQLAEEKIHQGLAKDSTRATLHLVWANILMATGNPPEVTLPKLKTAMHLLNDDSPKLDWLRTYNNTATIYIGAQQPDSAFHYLNIVLKRDPDFYIGWFNLAVTHLRFKQDTARFYEHLETAFAKGLPVTHIAQDPDTRDLTEAPRMKLLMEKYKE